MPNILKRAYAYTKEHPAAVAAMGTAAVLSLVSIGDLAYEGRFGHVQNFMTGLFCQISNDVAGPVVRGVINVAATYGIGRAIQNFSAFAQEKCCTGNTDPNAAPRTETTPLVAAPGSNA